MVEKGHLKEVVVCHEMETSFKKEVKPRVVLQVGKERWLNTWALANNQAVTYCLGGGHSDKGGNAVSMSMAMNPSVDMKIHTGIEDV